MLRFPLVMLRLRGGKLLVLWLVWWKGAEGVGSDNPSLAHAPRGLPLHYPLSPICWGGGQFVIGWKDSVHRGLRFPDLNCKNFVAFLAKQSAVSVWFQRNSFYLFFIKSPLIGHNPNPAWTMLTYYRGSY